MKPRSIHASSTGRRSARGPLASAAALMLALTACGTAAGNGSGGGGGGGGEGGEWSPGTYTIGLEALTSGPASFAGVPVVQGAEMAIDEINESGTLGEGITLELDVQDSGGDPATAVSIANDFIRNDDTVGVICCTISGEAGAVRTVLDGAGMPTVTTVALLEGMNAPPNLYRVALLPGAPGEGHDQLVDLITESEDIKTVAIANTADSQGQVAEFERWKEKLEEVGVEVVRVIETFIADRDFTGPATTVAELDPDLFLVGMYGDTGALMIDAVRDRGYEGTIISNYGISGENAYEQGGAAMDGAVFPVPFFADSPVPAAQEFIDRYEERYGEEPDTFAVNGYMAAHLLAEGFRNAEEPSREGIAQAMSQVESIPDMPVGDLILEDGQATIDEYFMVTWREGTTVLWEPDA